MKYSELIEGQSHIASIFCWNLLQLDNEEHQKVISQIIAMADDQVPESVLEKISLLPYP